ncbi:unnamed protein product [Prorocentrum cordatum]|uniref:Uncharacterized protein n=1 Tax=Prorocentrum cordatum TaxID=2364126 RepID=A0ABN9WPL8_9DINO|nr:unnamed protein product [Polarella glacialis]
MQCAELDPGNLFFPSGKTVPAAADLPALAPRCKLYEAPTRRPRGGEPGNLDMPFPRGAPTAHLRAGTGRGRGQGRGADAAGHAARAAESPARASEEACARALCSSSFRLAFFTYATALPQASARCPWLR